MTTNKQAPAAADGSKTAADNTNACTEIKTQDAAGSKADGPKSADEQDLAATAGPKTATANTETLAANKTQDGANSKAAGSPTNKQAPAAADGSKTAAADTKACAEIETQDTAGAGSRAAGSGGNTSETALPGAHGALKAEMAAKQAQVDAYEAIWEAGKLAAQRDASKAALNALDNADSQYSVDAVRNASDAWRAAANAAAHAKSVAKDKTEVTEQAHKKATYEAAKQTKKDLEGRR